MDFSLFYFADDSDASEQGERYRLLLDGARFADDHGFAAVWTPERHFHPFGGGYPNPAVTGAAVAAVTKNIGIRAGSVVAPLHPPVRIAEEWSVVDNLSGGRVGVSFASGWHAVDFAIRPENYANRRDVVVETINSVRDLWRGNKTTLLDGEGKSVEVKVYPPPVSPELPVWLTSSGSPETFKAAGSLGVGVLTHLLGQDLKDLKAKIATYRESLPEGTPGHVALMLHTFLGADRDEVREVVREPFSAYLRSSIGLIIRASGDILPGVDPDSLSPEDIDFLVERSFDRYFDTGGLFGTVEDGTAMLDQLHEAGVDEVACLIDFVGNTDTVLGGLKYLDRLKNTWKK
ncbi:natural product biosynthesis luciferase-like monooxygenase domain-containing protein [Actinokineospora alba]|uniref:Natural product biosynthesis luciferase-like monooxygenase domain-containing protein n=1 Tax=Actinokineospora alba TaxID=504798 RepID=A0A1H0R7K5_9PSEU|nr:MupA/Atu3671 family FMN-dependent luciferase-like monooxygenase [Actinokineospora alba]TDP70213.1 natural product biosynthesis luciferase-like monooxygenase protein [Actinokineospora alba]SDI36689.1 natural product biosynthesis luciferase-like monooxygenase domain-containing protein [Actinokineospora alba]SDP25471.1 natural product biosynthesis luciferase-like monooxygenase domain-containing protein [Actinokineospora alba]